MILRKIVSGIVSLLSVAYLICATTSPVWAVDGVGSHRFWTDAAVFRMGEGSPNGYVEFYFEIKRADLSFRRTEGMLRADVESWVYVNDDSGAPVDSVVGAFASTVSDSVALSDSNFTVFFALALELSPGDYMAKTLVRDLTTQQTSTADVPLTVPSFDVDTLTLSDIQLGYDIQMPAGQSGDERFDVLVKNGYKTYPDCRGLIGADRERLYFYSETYNLRMSSAEDSYTVEFSIVPTDGTPARSLGIRELEKPGESAVLANSFGVADLESGVYRFRIDVYDPASDQAAWAEKAFQVVKPLPDSLTEEEIANVREIIAYIVRPSELETFDRLNAVGKRNFLIQFWRDRDPTPNTPTNEFRQEHLRRMNYANERFSVGFRNRDDGWRSDRGRVYIVYGPPTEIYRYPFTPDNPPAEQWLFDNLPNQGEAYFLFIDENGYGDYRLVHSTARGERRDPEWERKITSGEFERPR